MNKKTILEKSKEDEIYEDIKPGLIFINSRGLVGAPKKYSNKPKINDEGANVLDNLQSELNMSQAFKVKNNNKRISNTQMGKENAFLKMASD